MATVPITGDGTNAPATGLGFSANDGVNWSDYLAYRPVYPASFFNRIFDYHAQKPVAMWHTAHDVGAGCGVVSSTLATRFDNVVVSDPNEGYTTLARQILVEKASLPESKFTFLQEVAETSSTDSRTVDLVTACECIQYTATDTAIKEFGRQLKPGGTLAITFYTRPVIDGNEQVQKACKAIWDAHADRNRAKLYSDAYQVGNSALEVLGFPEEEWETVKRIYINARGSTSPFMLNDRVGRGESQVKDAEEKIWVEDDEDWCDIHDIHWFKAYFATWAPSIPESDIQGLWDTLEHVLGGRQVKTRTPVVMVLATRRA
ncbi:S-adenosyl-L-methionine-dependent methyltransferase [Hypomontagnella monticulosa]|nr:S-adenosyl-L-methionine-dependent methyltransferase [Hypomontagnella monticulosa]